MASLVLSGDTSGSITVSAPAVAGSTTQTLVNVTGTLAPLVSGTTITLTNQTAPDFTSIPSWVKRITVMLSGVSTNSTGAPLIQLGDSGGYETTGYLGSTSSSSGSGTSNTLYTTGFGLFSPTTSAANTFSGSVTITLLDAATNLWACAGVVGYTNAAATTQVGGSKALSATLDRIRLFIDGTQQFDAGTFNILYE
jgi:hypothetical protein